jgi:choline dehydrogenase
MLATGVRPFNGRDRARHSGTGRPAGRGRQPARPPDDHAGLPITGGTTLLHAGDDASVSAYRLARRGPLASLAQGLAMLPLQDGDAPDLQVYCTLLGFEPGMVPISRPAVTALTVLLTPASRGTVRLRSADVADAPAVDPAYLGDEADRKALR